MYGIANGFAVHAKRIHTHASLYRKLQIGIAEAALGMGDTERYPIPAIYLHLVAVMDYMSLKQTEQAQKHLLAAWEIARPDDLIEGFGGTSRASRRDAGGSHQAGLAGGFQADYRHYLPFFRRMAENTQSGHRT